MGRNQFGNLLGVKRFEKSFSLPSYYFFFPPNGHCLPRLPLAGLVWKFFLVYLAQKTK